MYRRSKINTVARAIGVALAVAACPAVLLALSPPLHAQQAQQAQQAGQGNIPADVLAGLILPPISAIAQQSFPGEMLLFPQAPKIASTEQWK